MQTRIQPKPMPKQKRIKLTGKAYTELRKALHKRARGHCESCCKYAPLLDEDGQFDVFRCGHVSHIKSKGAGGDDSPENCLWECFYCNVLVRSWGCKK